VSTSLIRGVLLNLIRDSTSLFGVIHDVLTGWDDKYQWNDLDYSEVTVERDSCRSQITSLASRFNATCSCNLSDLLLQLCLLLIRLVRIVASRCDFKLLLFKLGV